MICVCVGQPSILLCQRLLPTVDMAEIRLDGANLSTGEIQQIFSIHPNLIATYRPDMGMESSNQRKNALLTAVDAGAAYIDIEIEADPAYKKEIIPTAHLKHCQVILSYHNQEQTPLKKQLQNIIDRCFSQGAQIAKIACAVHSETDCARILSLYDSPPQIGKIIAIGMGEKGKITRLVAPLLGAPFTYASMAEGKQTAPGQFNRETLEKILDLIVSG